MESNAPLVKQAIAEMIQASKAAQGKSIYFERNALVDTVHALSLTLGLLSDEQIVVRIDSSRQQIMFNEEYVAAGQAYNQHPLVILPLSCVALEKLTDDQVIFLLFIKVTCSFMSRKNPGYCDAKELRQLIRDTYDAVSQAKNLKCLLKELSKINFAEAFGSSDVPRERSLYFLSLIRDLGSLQGVPDNDLRSEFEMILELKKFIETANTEE